MLEPRISLDGTWDFLHLADDRLSGPAEVRAIEVPGVWQAQFPGLRMRGGIGIYRRRIELAPDWLADSVWLRFGAVFHSATVWVNGELAGTNEGGFLPFSFEVTRLLRPGANEISVRVDGPTDDPADGAGRLAAVPSGEAHWHGPLSGIWQSVHLERRIPDHLTGLRLVPNRETGAVGAIASFARPLAEASEIRIEVRDPSGTVVLDRTGPVPRGITSLPVDFAISDVQSWSPEAPKLYRARLELRREGEVRDVIEDGFGFRTIGTHEGKFYLNGEPLYLRGALDQGCYPDTICTIPSLAFLEDQFRKAKELGLNCLRCRSDRTDPRHHALADRLGMLIWMDLPGGGLDSDGSRGRREKLLKRILDRDANHPSIVVWTIADGGDLVGDADRRDWLKRTFAWLKAYDPTRLAVDHSPRAPSFHTQTDIADYRFEAAIPDQRGAWERFVDDLSSRPAWLFSPHGDAVVTGREPLMCSGFGNWGLPDPEDLRDADGEEPWWFETGRERGEGIMYAHGVEHRFADWSLDRVFGSLRGFVLAAQGQQFRALKIQIEAMRRRPQLAGYVIAGLQDRHCESDGLLDMRRNPRAFHERFAGLNADTVIVAQAPRRAAWSGEELRIEVAIAHGAGPALEDSRLDLVCGDHTRQIALAWIEAPGVLEAGSIGIDVPELAEPAMQRIGFELRRSDGSLAAVNHLDLAFHPRRCPPAPTHPLVWSPDDNIRARFRALGYGLAGSLEESQLVVAPIHDEAIAAHVRAGASLLLLAETEMSLHPFFPHWQEVRVRNRDGTVWRDGGMSNFAWLRRVGPLGRLPGGPLLDEAFETLMPAQVISGCNLLDFQTRVFSGLVVGWVHKPVALGVERSYGSGRMVATTFRLLRDEALADPTATTMLDALVELALETRSSRLEQAVRAAEAVA